jgi:hypothetical protein
MPYSLKHGSITCKTYLTTEIGVKNHAKLKFIVWKLYKDVYIIVY